MDGDPSRSVEAASFEDAREPSTLRRPKVTLHYAQSLDGRIATRFGKAQWLSGEAATRFAHELRASADAVIVGSGTVLADDPLLTVRHVPGKNPLRVVLDGRGRFPCDARLATDTSAATIVATTNGAALPPHIERLVVPKALDGEGVDLKSVLMRLFYLGVRSIVVEGGGRVLTSFFRERLVDRVVVAIAPLVLGAGVEAVGDLSIERIDQALRFTSREVFLLGGDVMIDLTPLP